MTAPIEALDLAYLLLQASEAEYGIKLTTNNPQVLRQRLYAERRKHGDTFAHLTFIQPPVNPTTSLWIIRKDAKNGTPQN